MLLLQNLFGFGKNARVPYMQNTDALVQQENNLAQYKEQEDYIDTYNTWDTISISIAICFIGIT